MYRIATHSRTSSISSSIRSIKINIQFRHAIPKRLRFRDVSYLTRVDQIPPHSRVFKGTQRKTLSLSKHPKLTWREKIIAGWVFACVLNSVFAMSVCVSSFLYLLVEISKQRRAKQCV